MDPFDNFLRRDASWLVGWESIAKFTGCSISTCKRNKKFGMPVRRLPSGTVVALAPELILWVIYFNDALEEKKRKQDDPK
jgi:hypothetical protein